MYAGLETFTSKYKCGLKSLKCFFTQYIRQNFTEYTPLIYQVPNERLKGSYSILSRITSHRLLHNTIYQEMSSGVFIS